MLTFLRASPLRCRANLCRVDGQGYSRDRRGSQDFNSARPSTRKRGATAGLRRAGPWRGSWWRACRNGWRRGGSAVDHLDVAVMRGGDGVHQPVPHARLSPPREAVVAGRARTKALGQVAPWGARTQHPEDAVQHRPVVHSRHTSWLVGQERLDHAPLEVGWIISAHAARESEFSASWKPPIGRRP